MPSHRSTLRLSRTWWRQRQLAEDVHGIGTLRDLNRLVPANVAECLGRPARRPGDRHRGDAGRVFQADRLDEAVAAEAGVVADGAMDRTGPAVAGLQVHTDRGPQRRAVGPAPDQLDLQPVPALARVLKQGVRSEEHTSELQSRENLV